MPRIHAVALSLLAASAAAGCQRASGVDYEERYRIFYANTPTVRVAEGTPLDAVARSFEPRVAVDQSFRQLTEEGYKLVAARPLPWGRGAVLFQFRKERLVEGQKPPAAPLEFAGFYAPADGDASGVHYFFEPASPSEYYVHEIGPTGHRVVQARWDGRQLAWREGGVDRSAVLDSDDRFVDLMLDEGGPAAATERLHLVRIKRVKVQMQPESVDDRTAYKSLYRLRPKTLAP